MTRQGQARCIAGLYISSVVLFVPLLPAGAWALWLHYRNPDALSRPLVRQFGLTWCSGWRHCWRCRWG